MRRKPKYEFFVRILKGEAEEKSVKHFQNWLAKSEKNKEYFEEFKRTWSFMGNVHIDKPHSEIEKQWYKLQSKIYGRRINHFNKIMRNIFNRYIKTGIILLIPLLIFGTLLLSLLNNKNTGKFIITNSTGKFETKTIILPDSTCIILNSSSKIYISNTQTREVKLKGEAYFIVNPIAKTTFKVNVDPGTILVHGTEFNVKNRNGKLTIYVKTGKVSFESLEGTKIYLNDRDVLNYNHYEGIFKVAKSDRDIYTQWRWGNIVFENQTLVDVLNELKNYYEFDYVFANRKAMRKRITGMFHKGLTLEKIIKTISFATGLNIEINEAKQGVKLIKVN